MPDGDDWVLFEQIAKGDWFSDQDSPTDTKVDARQK